MTNVELIKNVAERDAHPDWFCGEKECSICRVAWRNFEGILNGTVNMEAFADD